MGMKLNGKVAIVTGGSSGIGLGIAKEYAAEGATVYITGRRQSELDKAVAAIGRGAIAVQADAANLGDLDKLYETVQRNSGHIDILVLNAGFYEFMKIGEITEEHFDKTYNTNVRGLVFGFQRALPLLRDGASIILTGSIAASKGIPNMSVYSSTKAAVRNLVRGWIIDLKERKFRINVLSPGHTVTPGLAGLIPAEAYEGIAATTPIGRMGTPEDMGKAAVFLASDDSAFITGVQLDVDGGVAQY